MSVYGHKHWQWHGEKAALNGLTVCNVLSKQQYTTQWNDDWKYVIIIKQTHTILVVVGSRRECGLEISVPHHMHEKKWYLIFRHVPL